MQFLTDFADQAVVLPLAAYVLVVLATLGWRRGALAWGAAVAGVLGVMLVPSGHTATAAVVYGGLLAMLVTRSAAGTLLAAGLGGALAALVGLTRLMLHVHTVGDVLVGAAVGVAGAVAMRRLAGVRPARPASPWALLVGCVVVFALHGTRLQAETRLHWLAVDVWPLNACR